jgi:Putative metallopeptidase
MIGPLHCSRNHLLFLALLALSLSGCHKQSGEIATKPSSTPTVADNGDLKLQYQPRKTRRQSDDARRVGGDEQAIAAVIADLNNKVALPFDIFVSWSDCDQPDAYYEPETHKLVICHQLIDEYYDLFAPKVKDKTKLDDAVRGATAATFFHELGHALIDAWKLPITGKEEDAADQLSTVVLINRTDSGERMALDGAISFKLYADLSKNEKKIYWDEHSLDEQRFYDTICMIYGHNPQKYEYLIANGTLPEERAGNCQEDFKRIDRSWRMLLAPHLK